MGPQLPLTQNPPLLLTPLPNFFIATLTRERMSDQSNLPQRTDPPIFAKLNPKTQGLLRQTQKAQEALDMASEQT